MHCDIQYTEHHATAKSECFAPSWPPQSLSTRTVQTCVRGILPFLIIFPPCLLRLYMLACFSLPNSAHLLCRAKMAATAREKIQESERGKGPLSHFRHQHALTCMAPVGSDVGSTIVVDKTFCSLQIISLQRQQQHSLLITFVAVCTCWIHAALNLNACPDYS